MTTIKVKGVKEINDFEYFDLEIQVTRERKELYNKLMDALRDNTILNLEDLNDGK